MTWKLVVVEGAEEPTEYLLENFPVSIGRRRDNQIAIEHGLVSRYHCQIVRLPGGLRIADVGSRNGLQVNGNAVSAHELNDGDEIQIGPLRMRLEQSSEPPERDESPAKPELATQPGPRDPVELLPTVTDHLPLSQDPARAIADLRALLDLCTDLQSEQTPDGVQRRLVTALFDMIPAERGAVVLAEPGTKLSTTLGVDRIRGDAEVDVSRSTLESVIEEDRTFLRNGIQADPQGVAESLVAAEIEAALAVPMTSRGTTFGAVYLDTKRSDQPFDQAHLNMAKAAAALCAPILEAALREERVRRGARALREESGRVGFPDAFEPRMQAAVRLLSEAAEKTAPALIIGPQGAGRRRAAESIHYQSSAADGPFVVLNCAGRPAERIERELWGPLGALHRARGGTLYVREIGSLTHGAQAQLVSLLDEERMPARLIASASFDLRPAAAAGRFDAALLHRLHAHEIEIPSLRERGSDAILALASVLAKNAADLRGRPWNGFARNAEQAIRAYEWPGNVRELENAIERAERLCEDGRIEAQDLPDAVVEASPAGFHELVLGEKRRIIIETLAKHDGSVSAAAEELKLNRTYLHRLIRQLEIDD